MKRMLLDYTLVDVQEATSPPQLHHASLGLWMRMMLGDWRVDRHGQRGALLTICFGPESRAFAEDLPGFLTVQAWEGVSRSILRPSHDPGQRLRVLALPGVAPEALGAWRALAPRAPSAWIDFHKPTVDHSIRSMAELQGVLDESGTYQEPTPAIRAMMAFFAKTMGEPVLEGFAAIPGIRPGTGQFAVQEHEGTGRP